MTFKSVAAAWRSAYDYLHLSRTSAVQQRETKNAFYAGFSACFETVVSASKNNIEKEAHEVLNALHLEIADWLDEEVGK